MQTKIGKIVSLARVLIETKSALRSPGQGQIAQQQESLAHTRVHAAGGRSGALQPRVVADDIREGGGRQIRAHTLCALCTGCRPALQVSPGGAAVLSPW